MTSPALPRRLGTVTAAGTLVGIMIGSGIFRVPSSVAAHLPSPSLFLAVWIVGGLLALAGALMFGELAAMFPDTGGRYVYLREGVHPAAAFSYAVGNLLFLRPVSLSARALLIAGYLASLVPALTGHDHIVAFMILAVLSAANYRSTLAGAWLTTLTSAAKVIAVGGLAAIALLVPVAPALPTPFAPATPTLQGFGLALVTVMWTYSGWGSTTYITGEVRDAERVMPRVLGLGVAFVVALFLVVNLGYLSALGLPAMASSTAVATDAATATLGAVGGQVLAVLVVVSVMGSLTGSMLTAPRLPFAMGADAPRLARLAAIHARYQTPHAAIVATLLLAIIYLWGRSFEQLIESYILGSWPFYVLTAWGFFRLRRTRPELHRPFRVPGYPLVPGFFLIAAAAMVINGFAADPLTAVKGSWVMLVGIPVWFLTRARQTA